MGNKALIYNQKLVDSLNPASVQVKSIFVVSVVVKLNLYL
jgi:hypothetical protein